MKRYSNKYPLIFGLICIVVGIILMRIDFILVFGLIPVLIFVLLTIHEKKAKKRGEEENAEWVAKSKTPAYRREENVRSYANDTFVCAGCGETFNIKYRVRGNLCGACAKKWSGRRMTDGIPPDNTPDIVSVTDFHPTEIQYKQMKAVAQKYFPANHDEFSVAMQTRMKDMLGPIISMPLLKYTIDEVWDIPAGLSDEDRKKAIAYAMYKTVTDIHTCIETQKVKFTVGNIEKAETKTLLKAWLALDYYAFRAPQRDIPYICALRDYIHKTILTKDGKTEDAVAGTPVKFEGQEIYIDSAALLGWKRSNPLKPQFEMRGTLPLTEKEPKISLYEDGIKTREYCLQTENDEDFTGKYFQISVRLGIQGDPAVPVGQIDGFISDTPENREMKSNHVGYRMEGHYLACGGDAAKQRYEAIRGQDLVRKGLKYPGYTTPANIRLIGICPACKKSFAFHGYAFYMMQMDVAYSDDGLDVCEIAEYNIDKENWSYETEGKTFRYYNSFNCPHCGTPYIDYQKHPENKAFGVSGCVHLGRKHYRADSTAQEPITTASSKAEEYLDDVTFIRDLKHSAEGAWHQYDILLASRGYGWDMMISWADYMAEADLNDISEVIIGELGGGHKDITPQYRENGNRLKNLSEITVESGMLSIAGFSKTLKAPTKIVWVNQTHTLCIFTLEEDEATVKKYAETVIRRTFGTEKAMKLGKPIPEGQ